MAWRYFFGLFLLAIGIGFLLELLVITIYNPNFQFIMVLQAWWPLIIIGAGVNQFVRHKEQPWGSLIVFALGILLLAVAHDAVVLHPLHSSWKLLLLGNWKLLLAIVVMALAMRMMAPRRVQQYQTSSPGLPAGTKVRFEHSIHDRQVFGSTRFRNDSQQFLGGKLGAILGDYELDLRGASLALHGADLRVQSIFGTVSIRVPQQMVLDIAGMRVLAGVENTTQQIVSIADGLPTLKIRYFALFGAVEITN
jgi:predicted membrane protein